MSYQRIGGLAPMRGTVGLGRRFPQISYLLLLATVSSFGCPRPEREEPAPPPQEPDSLPELRVHASRTDLVFTFFDPEAGAFRSATRIEDVPPERRRNVVVVDLSLTPEQRGASRYVALADLSAPRPDGTYPVAIASRLGFEAQVVKTSTAAAPAGLGRELVLYSASWCGACKKARRFLDGIGVRYTEKDIEASRSAAEELAQKAARAGIQPGGVPVIDVGGVLMQGFEESSLRKLLGERGFL